MRVVDDSVNPRRYQADGRRRAAAARRGRVLDAAVAMIGTRGYTATTMAALAASAEVSVEYLYKTFGDKPQLVRQLLDYVLGGDEQPLPTIERPEIQQIRAEPDPRTVLALYARRCADVNGRSGSLLLAMSAAAPGDAQLAEVTRIAEAQRLGAATAVATDVASKGRLRGTVEDARDAVWTLNAPEVWDLTVRRRGWSAQRYAGWLTTLWVADLLGGS